MAINNTIMGLGLNAGLGNLSGMQSQSQAQQGSINSASSSNYSGSQGWSNTAGLQATGMSAASAEKANQMQMAMTREAMEFNAREAQIQRDWQEKMANTVYTRSVKNMIEAGINPILAASAGLSAASVGSGMSANISAPSAFMGQTFPEQNSASSSNAYGSSTQSGSSWGSEWSNSESGLATGIQQLANLTQDALNAVNSSKTLENLMNKYTPYIKTAGEKVVEGGKKAVDAAKEAFQDNLGSFMFQLGNNFTKPFKFN